MFLKEQSSGDLVEILSLEELLNPHVTRVNGRYHHGEELQDPEPFSKSGLVFPSDETLPRCWTDPRYREANVRAR